MIAELFKARQCDDLARIACETVGKSSGPSGSAATPFSSRWPAWAWILPSQTRRDPSESRTAPGDYSALPVTESGEQSGATPSAGISVIREGHRLTTSFHPPLSPPLSFLRPISVPPDVT